MLFSLTDTLLFILNGLADSRSQTLTIKPAISLRKADVRLIDHLARHATFNFFYLKQMLVKHWFFSKEVLQVVETYYYNS